MQGTNNDIFLLVEKLLVNAKRPNGTDRTLTVAIAGGLVAVTDALRPVVVVAVAGRRPVPIIPRRPIPRLRDYPRLPQVLVHQVQLLLGGKPPVAQVAATVAFRHLLRLLPLMLSQHLAHLIDSRTFDVEDKPTPSSSFLALYAETPNCTNRTLMDIVETVPVAIIEALSMVAVVNMLGRRPEPVLIPNYPRLPQFLVHQVQFLLGGQPPVEKATTMAARYQILGFPPLEPSQNIAHFVCHLPVDVEDKPTAGATLPYPIVP